MQSKKQSAVETTVNIGSGYVLALITQIVVFPLFGMHPKLSENLAIVGIFTVVSLVRSYTVRRIFNKLHRV